jgi:hypothetical protein
VGFAVLLERIVDQQTIFYAPSADRARIGKPPTFYVLAVEKCDRRPKLTLLRSGAGGMAGVRLPVNSLRVSPCPFSLGVTLTSARRSPSRVAVIVSVVVPLTVFPFSFRSHLCSW